MLFEKPQERLHKKIRCVHSKLKPNRRGKDNWKKLPLSGYTPSIH